MKAIRFSTQLLFFVFSYVFSSCVAQTSPDWLLEKMPVDLESDFALSALPPHLREHATVYLLDPMKGYYIAKQGTNGFSTFIQRTEWERGTFVPDTYSAISFDPEGTRTHLPVHLAVAEMRASGKFTALQIRDIIIKRVKDGTYKAPSRAGVSYMLAPLLRSYEDDKIVNLVVPHYMFYAPGVDNADIGGRWDVRGPIAIGSDVTEKQYSIFNFIILPEGKMEKAAIIEANKTLLKRLAEYKSYLAVNLEPNNESHKH